MISKIKVNISDSDLIDVVNQLIHCQTDEHLFVQGWYKYSYNEWVNNLVTKDVDQDIDMKMVNLKHAVLKHHIGCSEDGEMLYIKFVASDSIVFNSHLNSYIDVDVTFFIDYALFITELRQFKLLKLDM